MTHPAPFETDELWPFTVTTEVTVNGVTTEVTATTGVEACITGYGVRPVESDWQPAVVRDGKTLVRVAGRRPGDQAWARVTRGDEVARFLLGTLPLF